MKPSSDKRFTHRHVFKIDARRVGHVRPIIDSCFRNTVLRPYNNHIIGINMFYVLDAYRAMTHEALASLWAQEVTRATDLL